MKWYHWLIRSAWGTMENNTSILPDRNYDAAITAFISVSALVIFIENVILLVFLCKLLIKYNSGKEQIDVIIQVVFVCAIDTLSSFVFFVTGRVRVTDDITARLCVYTILLSSTLQFMSQSNIMCICAFRYYVARNVRKLGPRRHSLFTVVSLIVNVTVGVLCMTSFSVTMKLNSITDGANMACRFLALVTSKSTGVISKIYAVVGFIVTIIADVLCGMTVHRLKKEINNVQPVTTSTSTSGLSSSTGTIRQSTKTHQQNAIFTIFLIVLFFNLSTLPVLFGRTLLFAGVKLPANVHRISYLCLYFNSFFNPIIIAKRVPEIKRSFKNLLEQCLNWTQSCCNGSD